jgi:hypothetical protein
VEKIFPEVCNFGFETIKTYHLELHQQGNEDGKMGLKGSQILIEFNPYFLGLVGLFS